MALLWLTLLVSRAEAETGGVTALSAAASLSHPSPSPTPAPRRRRASSASANPRIVHASWYSVPANSLARRRAGRNELTAAHNHLPLGTKVRITNTKNGRSVFVRITDRGIHDRRAQIDLCKEAAQQLDFVRDGIARVRLEVADDTTAATSDGGSTPVH
jgi:rare lipoprotein A